MAPHLQGEGFLDHSQISEFSRKTHRTPPGAAILRLRSVPERVYMKDGRRRRRSPVLLSVRLRKSVVLCMECGQGVKFTPTSMFRDDLHGITEGLVSVPTFGLCL